MMYMINENEIVSNYKSVLEKIPQGVQLVAVSKTHPVAAIKTLYHSGQKTFGENKVQELLEKAPQLPNDIQWHLIGHLQTNKVKYISDFIHTIQSVDSAKLIQEISKQAMKANRTINVLLQIKIAEEDTKYGLEKAEAEEILKKYLDNQYPNVEIKGLMGMASFTENTSQIKAEFQSLKAIFDEFSALHQLETLSMGMSGDFEIAIECGSNSVRVGSAIFGHRQYDL